MSLCLLAVPGDLRSPDRLAARYENTGKKRNIAKSSIRFKWLDDVPMNVIAARKELGEYRG